MYCEKCGTQVLKNAKFCQSCGSQIDDTHEDGGIPSNEQNANESVVVQHSTLQKKEEVSEYTGRRGLGGWLILVMIGLFISGGFGIYNTLSNVASFTDGSIDILSDPSSEVYLPGIGGIIGFETFLEIIFLIATALLLVLFFKKSSRFPKLYITFLVASAIYILIDYALVASISVSGEAKLVIDEILAEEAGGIGRAMIGALIWVTYMVKSKQVKATFIN